jgi:hypothetical protein
MGSELIFSPDRACRKTPSQGQRGAASTKSTLTPFLRSAKKANNSIRSNYARENRSTPCPWPADYGDCHPNSIYTLIATAKLNDIDPQAWLAHVLACLPDRPAKRIRELLPWNWKAHPATLAA